MKKILLLLLALPLTLMADQGEMRLQKKVSISAGHNGILADYNFSKKISLGIGYNHRTSSGSDMDFGTTDISRSVSWVNPYVSGQYYLSDKRPFYIGMDLGYYKLNVDFARTDYYDFANKTAMFQYSKGTLESPVNGLARIYMGFKYITKSGIHFGADLGGSIQPKMAVRGTLDYSNIPSSGNLVMDIIVQKAVIESAKNDYSFYFPALRREYYAALYAGISF